MKLRVALACSLALAAGLALVPAVALAGDSPGQVLGGVIAQKRPAGAAQPTVIHRGRVGQSGAGARVVAPQPVASQPVATFPIARTVVTPSTTTSAFFFASSYAPAVSYETVAYDPPVAYARPAAYAAVNPYPSATAVTYTAPYVYEPSLVIYNPNVSETVASTQAVAVAPSAPTPMPSVVEYSTGRYELRGDGMAMPYAWVWIPNPPPGPPISDPPTAASSPAPERDDPPGPRLQKLYRWTDAAGATHWTDRLEKVPQQHRAAAEK